MYLNKVNKMFERGIEMSLLSQLHHFWKVLVVNVGIDTEKALQNCFGYGEKVLGEWNT